MKGGSEDVRLVQAAQRCGRLGTPAVMRSEQSREAGAGAEGAMRGRKVAHLQYSERIATPPAAAFFGALSASAPAHRR